MNIIFRNINKYNNPENNKHLAPDHIYINIKTIYSKINNSINKVKG
jgi:hypothetical protein